jgi:hypothetical protein
VSRPGDPGKVAGVKSQNLGRITAVAVAAAVIALGGCGYDTHNQNSPNSTQVGTNTANPTP